MQDGLNCCACLCSEESIYVMDSHKLASLGNVPECNPDELFIVSSQSGQIFLKGSEEAAQHKAEKSHWFGAHSAPWYFAQVDHSLLALFVPLHPVSKVFPSFLYPLDFGSQRLYLAHTVLVIFCQNTPQNEKPQHFGHATIIWGSGSIFSIHQPSCDTDIFSISAWFFTSS